MQIFQLAVLLSALFTLGLAAPVLDYNELVARGCVDKRDPDKRVTGSCTNYKRDAESPVPEVDELIARACVDKRDPDKRVTGSCSNYKRGSYSKFAGVPEIGSEDE